MSSDSAIDFEILAQDIKRWGKELGFQQIGISDIDLTRHEPHLRNWLSQGFHGDMQYMQENVDLRLQPGKLHPGTLRIISARMDYLPPNAAFAKTLSNPDKAYVSRYAVGRDYHKVLRKRLKKLGDKIQQQVPGTQFRPFVDSAPVLEHAVAEKAGIGWTGKHSLTLHPEAGSWFFLGELFVNLPLPTDQPIGDKCGSCTACITICPTGAITAPYVVDGRRCISYLTIENKGKIPEQYRKAIGNRIYGCDDCQLICPWNRFAKVSLEPDFAGRDALLDSDLVTLFQWDEATFLKATEGSAIRRIGHERWRRNIAVAMGNAQYSEHAVAVLQAGLESASPMLAEHIEWALQQLKDKQTALPTEKQAPGERKTPRLIRSIIKGIPRDA